MKADDRQMTALDHESHDMNEQFEVTSLRRTQWVLFEHRDDAGRQVG